MDESHSKEEARKLFLRLAKRYHPDLAKSGNVALNNQLMQRINEAWDCQNFEALREIDQRGVDYLTLKKSAPENRWQSETRDFVNAQSEELRREAIKREVMSPEAKPARAFVQKETPRWGPRPEFSYIYGDEGKFFKMLRLLKFWNPCANWVANGAHLIFIRMLMQLSIIAAWVFAGVWSWNFFRNFRAEDSVEWALKIAGFVVSGAVIFAAGIVLFVFARKSILRLLCYFLIAWAISEWLFTGAAVSVIVYSLAATIWMVRTCVDDG